MERRAETLTMRGVRCGVRRSNMPSDDVQMIGAANFQARTRTNAAGETKTRYTVTVRGDTVLFNTDPKTLGKEPAEAIAQVYRERISSIAAIAPLATQRARQVAAKAFAEGKSWAMRRYSGGRTGPMAPNQSDRAFNDSGRLVKSIAVGATSDGYVVNVAANRFDPTTLNGGEAALQRIFARLRELVPELADTRRLMDSIPVRRAMTEGMKSALVKAGERRVQLEMQRMQTIIGVVRQLVG